MCEDPMDADQLEPSASVSLISNDIICAYGPMAKAFALSRIQNVAEQHLSLQALDFWSEVAEVVWALDPDASAGCPAHLASAIRLH